MLNKPIKMSRLPQIATPTRKPYPSDLSEIHDRLCPQIRQDQGREINSTSLIEADKK